MSPIVATLDAGFGRTGQNSSVENLAVLTSGPLPPNPADLFSTRRMDDVIAALTACIASGYRRITIACTRLACPVASTSTGMGRRQRENRRGRAMARPLRSGQPWSYGAQGATHVMRSSGKAVGSRAGPIVLM